MIRVLVVEDSATVRHRLCEVLNDGTGIEVVGTAVTGFEAIELNRRLRPDVITMDIVLPGLDGLAATEHIMAHAPTPILVVSAADNRAEVFTTYDALKAGAVDVLDKPSGALGDGTWEQRLRSAVRVVSKVSVITHPRAKLTGLRTAPPAAAAPVTGAAPLIALGASTGGPAALVELLRAVPPDLPAPILLVQHIGPSFAASYTEWLAKETRHRVRCARDGEPVPAGGVIMAPGDRHLLVQGGRLRLGDGPERHSCRPSVDVLFESVALAYPGAATGCLLTGMGRDGAAGLLMMRRAGCRTIAQDRATCVVWGMPAEAVRLDAVDELLPPAQIGRRLARTLQPTRQR